MIDDLLMAESQLTAKSGYLDVFLYFGHKSRAYKTHKYIKPILDEQNHQSKSHRSFNHLEIAILIMIIFSNSFLIYADIMT